jgi:hypothetical protein
MLEHEMHERPSFRGDIATVDRNDRHGDCTLRVSGDALEVAVLAVCSGFWHLREFDVNNPPKPAQCYEHWNNRHNRRGWLLDKLEQDIDALAKLVWGEDCDHCAHEPMTGDCAACEAEQQERRA